MSEPLLHDPAKRPSRTRTAAANLPARVALLRRAAARDAGGPGPRPAARVLAHAPAPQRHVPSDCLPRPPRFGPPHASADSRLPGPHHAGDPEPQRELPQHARCEPHGKSGRFESRGIRSPDPDQYSPERIRSRRGHRQTRPREEAACRKREEPRLRLAQSLASPAVEAGLDGPRRSCPWSPPTSKFACKPTRGWWKSSTIPPTRLSPPPSPTP